MVHVAALDSLRAIAALLVFAQHFSQQYKFAADEKWVARAVDTLGSFGVAVFFILSGFLIHSGAMIERGNNGSIFWGNYFWRRASRILPGYYIALIVCAIVVQFWQSELMLKTDWLGVLVHFLLLSSFVPGENVTVSGVFWTVVVECHFYAFYAVMWFFAGGGNLSRVVSYCVVGSIAFFLFVSIFVPAGPLRSLLQATAPALLWKWCLGVLLAEAKYSSRLPVLRRIFSQEFLVIPAILMIFGGCLLSNPSVEVNYKRFVLALGCFALVGVCIFSKLGSRRNRFLEWTGGISYSIYLWHPLALLLTLHMSALEGGRALVVAVVLTYIFAWVSHALIEQPGMAYGRRRVRSEVAFGG